MIAEFALSKLLWLVLLLNTIGIFSSLVQKMTVFKVKDNAEINVGVTLLEASIIYIGIVYTSLYSSESLNPVLT